MDTTPVRKIMWILFKGGGCEFAKVFLADIIPQI